MKVITDGIANDTPLQLPMFRDEVMPSSQSHQVGQIPTRSYQGNDEGGPASTTTPIADEKKNGDGYTSPLSFSSSFHPCCQQQKTEEKGGKWKCKYTSRDSHPPLPRPLCPVLATRFSLFLFQTDRIAFLTTPDIQLHRPEEERADRARVFLVRMRDPTLLHHNLPIVLHSTKNPPRA